MKILVEFLDSLGDFYKILNVGFKGYVGIEYKGSFMIGYKPEGRCFPTNEVRKATKRLLEKLRAEIA